MIFGHFPDGSFADDENRFRERKKKKMAMQGNGEREKRISIVRHWAHKIHGQVKWPPNEWNENGFMTYAIHMLFIK